MKLRPSEMVALGLVALSVAVSIYVYPQMPEQMASHWNMRGQVDGYLPKFWGLAILPIISAFLALLFIAIPKIDPLKANIEKFRKYFDAFVIVIFLFLFFIYIQTVLWAFGTKISMNLTMPIAIAALFFCTGSLLEKAKRNWFIGIRTPWTMSSDRVWDKTHSLGAILFKACALISLLGVAFPESAILFVILPVLFVTAYLTIYSYFEYAKEAKPQKKEKKTKKAKIHRK